MCPTSMLGCAFAAQSLCIKYVHLFSHRRLLSVLRQTPSAEAANPYDHQEKQRPSRQVLPLVLRRLCAERSRGGLSDGGNDPRRRFMQRSEVQAVAANGRCIVRKEKREVGRPLRRGWLCTVGVGPV